MAVGPAKARRSRPREGGGERPRDDGVRQGEEEVHVAAAWFGPDRPIGGEERDAHGQSSRPLLSSLANRGRTE